jgi:hypothetical protein
MAKGALNLSGLLADEYSAAYSPDVLPAAFGTGDLRDLRIPIASLSADHTLEAAGLIKCLRTEVSPSGKKCKFYSCQVDVARLTFKEGRFEIEVEWRDRGRPEMLRASE